VKIRALRIGALSLQRGFAMIALLALAALITAFLIASGLNLTSAGNSNEREDRSMSALRKAKAALIAYAASEQWQLYKLQPTEQPGGLPCPDADDDGSSEGATCSNALSRIGRLPWATIGAEDLRDASGERLWYAVSSNFRRLSGTTIINSDTQGLLTVTGAAPAGNVVAVVIAPGGALSGQDRILQHNSHLAYLEGVTVGGTDSTFDTVALPTGTANDRLLAITQAELMAVVEPVVAARIEREVKPLLVDYFTKWGRYPFAMTFASPPVAQGAYQGTSSPQTTMGLLPVTDTAIFTWQNPTVVQIPGGMGSPVLDTATCSISSLTVTCTVHYHDSRGSSFDDECRPNIQIQLLLANAQLAFADAQAPLPGDTSNFRMRDGLNNVPNNQGSPYGYWSQVGFVEPTQGFLATATGGLLTYTGRLQNANDMSNEARITITLPAPAYLPRLTNPNIAWFLSNQWYRQTYYAISSGYRPSSVGSCNPPDPSAPSCLTVNNLPGQTNNKQAILIFAGRALDGQIRTGPPGNNLPNYLEGENSTPGDLIFEHRAGNPTTINDRVVVVSP
jgi:type II secretory pathway pseudopilin PulG